MAVSMTSRFADLQHSVIYFDCTVLISMQIVQRQKDVDESDPDSFGVPERKMSSLENQERALAELRRVEELQRQDAARSVSESSYRQGFANGLRYALGLAIK